MNMIHIYSQYTYLIKQQTEESIMKTCEGMKWFKRLHKHGCKVGSCGCRVRPSDALLASGVHVWKCTVAYLLMEVHRLR